MRAVRVLAMRERAVSVRTLRVLAYIACACVCVTLPCEQHNTRRFNTTFCIGIWRCLRKGWINFGSIS